jgi:hypothetical protein
VKVKGEGEEKNGQSIFKLQLRALPALPNESSGVTKKVSVPTGNLSAKTVATTFFENFA